MRSKSRSLIQFTGLLGIALCSLMSACSPISKPAATLGNESALIAAIDTIVGTSEFNGVVLLTKDTTTLYSKAIGYADLAQKIPLRVDNQFVIGSISKQITAVLVLKAHEKGAFELEDAIGAYVPGLYPAWSDSVSIHHLLTHTHGIVKLDEALAFAPGTQFQYSQLGYELLAQLLEKLSGKSFRELSTELFAAHGLKHTFHPDNRQYDRLVKGYEESAKGAFEYADNSLRNYAAAGSFISNADDLVKWNQLLYAGKLVSGETLNLMRTRYATRIHPVFDKIEYGYGLLFKEGEQARQIGAFGYAPGFVSASYYYPGTNMNLIVLENTARKLEDFKATFGVHTALMKCIQTQ